MRLKYALTIGDPKSGQITAYQAKSTGSSHLTRDDVATALGVTQKRVRAGLNLLYAKFTKDAGAGAVALNELYLYALTIYKDYIRNSVEGHNYRAALERLSLLALEDYCRTADTPGARCLCGGKGELQDRAASKKMRQPVMKPCSRCEGSGLRPLTHTRGHHAIYPFVPISRSTWQRNWQPLYEALVTWCYRQESFAESEYNRITDMRPSTLESSGP